MFAFAFEFEAGPGADSGAAAAPAVAAGAVPADATIAAFLPIASGASGVLNEKSRTRASVVSESAIAPRFGMGLSPDQYAKRSRWTCDVGTASAFRLDRTDSMSRNGPHR